MPQFVTTSTAGPTAFSSVVLNCRRAKVLGKKAIAGTANAGAIKIGLSATAANQPISLAPDAELELEAAPGGRLDLSNWYFTVASSGDGVVVIYS